MSTKTKVIIGTLVILVSFAFGRYTVPTKIKIEKQIVEVEKKTEDAKKDLDINKHKETRVVEVTKPDGTKEKTTTTTEDSNSSKTSETKTTDQTAKSQTESKEVTRESQVTISALGGVHIAHSLAPLSGPLVFGAHVSKPVLGPITIGIWGLTDKTVGASIGLSF